MRSWTGAAVRIITAVAFLGLCVTYADAGVADSPPTAFLELNGNLDARLFGVAYPGLTDPSAEFSFAGAGIPVTATIIGAYLYTTQWPTAAPGFAAATPSWTGTSVFAAPLAVDQITLDGSLFYHTTHRFDVTAAVASGLVLDIAEEGLVNGDYTFATSAVNRSFGAALVVIFSDLSLPSSQVWLNDGAEALQNAISSTTFAGATAARPGVLSIFAEADDPGGSGELIFFNGIAVGGPIDQNLGDAASLFNIGVNLLEGTNTTAVQTGADVIGWDVALLVGGVQSAAVSGPASAVLVGFGFALIGLAARAAARCRSDGSSSRDEANTSATPRTVSRGD